MNRDFVEEREFERVGALEHGLVPVAEVIEIDGDGTGGQRSVSPLDAVLESAEIEVEEVQMGLGVQRPGVSEFLRPLRLGPEPVFENHVNAMAKKSRASE